MQICIRKLDTWHGFSAAEARESQAEVVILKRKLEDRSRVGTPRFGSPAPGNSPRMAASAQGSPLRGMPSQGALSSPLQGSPSTSAAFSPGSLVAMASESLESHSAAAPTQSSPDRAYSTQMSNRGEAANAAGQGTEEDEEPSLQVRQQCAMCIMCNGFG